MDRIIIPKNVLKEKAGSGGFSNDLILEAQEKIDNNSVDFTLIAEKYLARIRASLSEHSKTKDCSHLCPSILGDLTQLRAQGAMFHFYSITHVTDIVLDLIDSLENVDSKIWMIIDSYEKCASLLLRAQVKD